MAVFIIFLLGIGNFALHKAAMESRNSLIGELPWLANPHAKQAAFAAEFVILLAAMLLAVNGWQGLLWAYVIYSAINAVSAWLIFSGRV